MSNEDNHNDRIYQLMVEYQLKLSAMCAQSDRIAQMKEEREEAQNSVRRNLIEGVQVCNWAEVPDVLEAAIGAYWEANKRMRELTAAIEKENKERIRWGRAN